VSAILYAPIDENLRAQSKSNLIYMQSARYHGMQTQVGTGQFGSAYFTVIDTEGQVSPAKPDFPMDEALVSAALAGQEKWDIIKLENGTRVRIFSQPIYRIDPLSNQKKLEGVLQAASPLDTFDRTLNKLTVLLAVLCGLMLTVTVVGSNAMASRALEDQAPVGAHA
jgi:hypothetical protein